MLSYVRGFIVLFVLLTLLLYLPPGKSYQKYIRFFAEIILTLGILSPVLSVFCDSEEFLELIEYEEFMESLSEISRDTQKIEYINNDYYLEKYESAIEEDVSGIAEQYGFTVQEAKVDLSREYTVDKIQLWLTDRIEERIVVERIVPKEQEDETGTDAAYAGLRQKLSEYYQLDAAMIEIQYARNG